MHPTELSSIVPNFHKVSTGEWAYSTVPFNMADLEGAVPEQALSASQILRLRAQRRMTRIIDEGESNARPPISTNTNEWFSAGKGKYQFIDKDELKEIMASIDNGLYVTNSAYNPMVALPLALSSKHPDIIGSCRPYRWHSHIRSESWVVRGVWDPPATPPVSTILRGLPEAVLIWSPKEIIPSPLDTPIPKSIQSTIYRKLSASVGQSVPKIPQFTSPPNSVLTTTDINESSPSEPLGNAEPKDISSLAIGQKYEWVNLIVSLLSQFIPETTQDTALEASSEVSPSQDSTHESLQTSLPLSRWRDLFGSSSSTSQDELTNPIWKSTLKALKEFLTFTYDQVSVLPKYFTGNYAAQTKNSHSCH